MDGIFINPQPTQFVQLVKLKDYADQSAHNAAKKESTSFTVLIVENHLVLRRHASISTK
jgi:hypothetical protein